MSAVVFDLIVSSQQRLPASYPAQQRIGWG